MNIFSRDELRILVEASAEFCVSIFLPTHRFGRDTQQAPIRLKNLLREAEKRLLASGMRRSDVNELLAPPQSFLEDSLFWQYQSEGLGVFVSPVPETFRYYRVPIELDERVIVATRFHVKPLLPLLSGNGHFYVLALSQNEVRLLEGTRDVVHAADLEGVPRSLAEALKHDNPERQLQLRTAGLVGQGQQTAMFHGHGSGAEEAKDWLLRYFQQVNSGLRELLADEQAPLVLAGVEYLLPIYRKANTYAYLAEESITGNPEQLRPEELHERAWALVQPSFLKAREDAITQYRRLKATDQTSNRLDAVLPAAQHGRIESLFVATDHHEWGNFDPNTGKIEVQPESRPDNVDLLDWAAIQTILNRGIVYAVQREGMPDDSVIAAVFRY